MLFREYYQQIKTKILLENDETNKHLTHLDEYVLIHGKEGAYKTIEYIESLLGILKSDTNSSINTTVKWDGAPAVVVGVLKNKFFVATKSAFNPSGAVLNYSEEDIRKNHSGKVELINKLTAVFQSLSPHADLFEGAYQGDLLFTRNSLKTLNIDGEECVTFKPNTILYSVKADSVAGQKIADSEVGIVFHTHYNVGYDYGFNPSNDISGTIPKDTQPITEPKIVFSNKQFGINVDRLKVIPDAYITDALFEDRSGTISLTREESTIIKKSINLLRFYLYDIEFRSFSKKLYKDLTFFNTINTFLNSEIRSGSFLDDIENSLKNYTLWLTERIDKDISSAKKQETQRKKIARKNRVLRILKLIESSILNLFKFIKTVKFIKDIFIKKYNDIVSNQSVKSYLLQPNGDIVATSPEGYVAFDSDQNGVKFVNRLEFSRANFNMPKDWKGKEASPVEAVSENKFISFKKFLLENKKNAIVIWPGGFKPPHKGHFMALKESIKLNNASKAIVFIGKKIREGVNITAEQSKAIWDIYFKHLKGVDCEAIVPDSGNPVRPVYEYVDAHLEEDIDIVVAAGDKESDHLRYAGFKKDPKYKNVSIMTIPIQGAGISGTITREKLASNNLDDALQYFLPEEVLKDKGDVEAIKNILQNNY